MLLVRSDSLTIAFNDSMPFDIKLSSLRTPLIYSHILWFLISVSCRANISGSSLISLRSEIAFLRNLCCLACINDFNGGYPSSNRHKLLPVVFRTPSNDFTDVWYSFSTCFKDTFNQASQTKLGRLTRRLYERLGRVAEISIDIPRSYSTFSFLKIVAR